MKIRGDAAGRRATSRASSYNTVYPVSCIIVYPVSCSTVYPVSCITMHPSVSCILYRVSHDTGHLENLAKSQALYKHELDT